MLWRPQPAYTPELLAQWRALGQALGHDTPAWRAEGRRLVLSWSRWPRAYHDTTHLWACLRHLQSVQEQQPGAIQNPLAVALAIWYHDAIYWPWSGRNEERSAAWSTRFLHSQHVPAALQATVHQYILDTRHNANVDIDAGDPGPDAQWVVDIDLAVLGQSEAVYRRFEHNVRREYFFVRWPRYVAGRSAVLQGFLDHPRIYQNAWFFDRYEAQARTNLHHALQALRSGRLYD